MQCVSTAVSGLDTPLTPPLTARWQSPPGRWAAGERLVATPFLPSAQVRRLFRTAPALYGYTVRHMGAGPVDRRSIGAGQPQL